MKKIIISLMTMMALSAHAGTLVNKKTNESLKFEVGNDGEIELISNSTDVKSGKIKSFYTDKLDSIRLFAVTDDVCTAIWGSSNLKHWDEGLVTCLIIPGPNVPGLLSAAADIVMMPVKLPVKLIENGKHKKDVRILKRAVFTDEEIEVNEKRFDRISRMLNI